MNWHAKPLTLREVEVRIPPKPEWGSEEPPLPAVILRQQTLSKRAPRSHFGESQRKEASSKRLRVENRAWRGLERWLSG